MSLFIDAFSSRKSGKIVYGILGYMLHNSKSAAHHAQFGHYIAKYLGDICSPQARVPNLVTDGEVGLKQLIEVKI